MAKISILIAFLTHFLCALGQSQLSHCFEYFTYMTKPGTTDMLGQIEIPPPSANDIFYLKVALDTTTELSQVVRLELARSIKESVGRVHQGRPLLYHIYCPINEQIPSLSAIWFNSQRYCPNPEVSGNITANVELGHILFPLNKEPIVYSSGPWQEISQPWHRNLSIYRMDNPPYDRLNHYPPLECGITSYYTDDTNRLIPDGETTLPGQWPWVVAIYASYTENKIRFVCTGSILTTRHIITSGTCVTEWREDLNKDVLVNPQNLIVRFGQLILREWHVNHTGIINRAVVDIKISPESSWKVDYSAILILKTAVEYNAFIKPICLWSGSTNLQDTVNMTGYIVGWGGDYINRTSGFGRLEIYTGELRMTKVPLWEPSEFAIENNLKDFIYLGDYCADPGAGLMVFNTTTGRYQLRAVLTISVTMDCVFKYFDVAELTSWIRQQIYPT